MKVKETLVIMSLLGTLSQSTKLLKVPRIYNALITSDDNLQPSQAYPALAPVVQGIQYPGYVSSNVYRMLVVPNQVQYSDTRSYSYSVHNSIKEDYYHYNIVETGRPIQFDLSKIPIDEEKNAGQPLMFRPAVSVPDQEITHLPAPADGNIVRDNGRVVYYESSPVQPDDSPLEHRPLEHRPLEHRPLEHHPLKHHPLKSISKHTQRHNEGTKLPTETDNADVSTEQGEPETTEAEESKTDPRFNHFANIDGLVKNYRPEDTSIVDIPPPPVPVGKKPAKKPHNGRIEEYPPPPVGFL